MTKIRYNIPQRTKTSWSTNFYLNKRHASPNVVTNSASLADQNDNLAIFLKRSESTGSKVFTSPQTCADWLSAFHSGIVYIPIEFQQYIPLLSKHFQITTFLTNKEKNTVDACFTKAASGIAESGKIFLTNEYTPNCLAAMAPSYHIAILRRTNIRRSIADALAAMPYNSNMLQSTGSSKTATTNGNLIQGVHSHGVQACLII